MRNSVSSEMSIACLRPVAGFTAQPAARAATSPARDSAAAVLLPARAGSGFMLMRSDGVLQPDLSLLEALLLPDGHDRLEPLDAVEIGRASCRERVVSV